MLRNRQKEESKGGRVVGLGEISWLSFKSRATVKKEQEEYAKWAFPNGQEQRENLEKLLKDIYPKEPIPSLLIPYLTCKELYEGILEKAGSVDVAVDVMINKQKNYKQIIKKKTMTTYLALVLADAAIGESCQYPSSEQILAKVEELDSRRKKG